MNQLKSQNVRGEKKKTMHKKGRVFYVFRIVVTTEIHQKI